MIANEITQCHVESIVWHTTDSPQIEGDVVIMPPNAVCLREHHVSLGKMRTVGHSERVLKP